MLVKSMVFPIWIAKWIVGSEDDKLVQIVSCYYSWTEHR